jgi:hypothetical protein
MNYSHHPTLEPDGTLHVNNSSLKYVAECDLKSVLHALRLTSGDENVKMIAGSAIHTGFEHVFRGETPEAALDAFRAAYKEWADASVDPNGPLAAYTFDNIDYILAVWLSRYDIGADDVLTIASNGNPVLKILPTMVEVPFSVPLADDGLVLRGKMDAVVEEVPSGHLRILDHKSTGRIAGYFLEKFRLDSQFSLYVWGGQKHLEALGSDAKVIGGMVNAIEVGKLPDDLERKCSVHKVKYGECRPMHVRAEIVPVDRTEEELEEARRTAVHLARRYRELMLLHPTVERVDKVRTQGKFNGSCNFCFAKNFCEAGRPVKNIERMFTTVEEETDGNATAVG